MKKTILLTFDLEEFDLPLDFNQDIEEDDMYDISKTGLDSISNLLSNHNIKATFFTTANFAIKFPKIVEQLSINHEIASHGFSHSHPLTLENIKKAKQSKEQIINKQIKGFRAPRWDIKNLNIVEQAGFTYDSSTHPIYLPGRYFNLKQKRYIHKINNLLEIPASTLPPNFSIFWLAFKNLPLSYSKLFTRINFIRSNYTMLIFHPWEFSNLSKINIPKYVKRIHGLTLLKKLEKYILFCEKQNYDFKNISGYFETHFKV